MPWSHEPDSHSEKTGASPKDILSSHSASATDSTLFREILDNCREFIYRRSFAGDTFDYISPFFEELLGYSHEEYRSFRRDDFLSLIHPEDFPAFDRMRTHALNSPAKKITQTIEYRLKTKGGGYVWVSDRCTLFKDHQNNPSFVIGNARDITAEKIARDKLKQSEDLFSTFMGHLPGCCVFIKQPDGEPIYTNTCLLDTFGPRDEWLKRLQPDFRRSFEQEARRIDAEVLNGAVKDTIGSLPDKKGVYRIYRTIKFPIFRAGKPPLVGGIAMDIDEQIKAEQELRASEERYRLFVQNLQGIAYRTKPGTFRPEFLHGRCEDITGYDPNLLVTGELQWDQLVHPEDRPKLYEEGRNLASLPGRIGTTEYRIYRKDGEIRWVLDICSSTENPLEGNVAIQGIVHDITGRKKTEEALKVSEEQYRSFVHNFQGIAYRADIMANKLTFIGGLVEQITGYTTDDFLNRTIRWINLVDLEDAERIEEDRQNVFSSQHVVATREYRIHRKDGGIRWVSDVFEAFPDESGRFSAIQGAIYDITERKQAEAKRREMEAQIRQAQKMEAMGTLAGGIAHDFNNILGGIIAYTELSMLEIDRGHPAHQHLTQVLKAGDRAKDLVKQILAFSRQGEQELRPLRVSHVVKEALRLVRSSLPTTIEIRQEVNTQSDVILADLTQIHQVIMNLCTNARHAMRETGGVLTIGLSDADIAQEQPRLPHVPPVQYLKLTVGDTGHGMTEDIIKRIFDPFFTTKQPGEGTGMGLAVVHGIVNSLGGFISVASTPGRGTTFEILLPKVESSVKVETDKTQALPGGTERILLVDDEVHVVDPIKRSLEVLGYTVAGYTSSLAALEEFIKNPEGFDLVITDQTMPKMTGAELAKEMLAIRNDLPIILCTGFSEIMSEDRARAIGIRQFVLKPVVMRRMAVIIRDVLKKD